MRCGLLFLFLAAVGCSNRADFDADAMQARAEELRPDVEAALGASLGDAVEVRVSSPDTLKEILTRELVAERAQIAGGPRDEELEAACAQEAAFASRILFAKVEVETGVIHVCPKNFQTMAAFDDSLKALLSQDLLDTVLLHEMVHVFQVRRLALAQFVGTPPSAEQLTARSAVIEGHAQYVGRIAAKRRGLAKAMALMDRAQTEVPASVTDPAIRHLAEVLSASFSFAYIEGEKFVGAIVAKLGYEKAVERIFSAPPETLRAVSNPGEYLEPPAPDSSLDDMAALVQRMLVERGRQAQVIPFPAPALRAALSPAGPKVAEAAMSALDKAVATISAGDPQIVIALLSARDEAGGTILYDADMATSKAKDELFSKPGSQIRIVETRYDPVSFDETEGVQVTKTVEVAAATRQYVGTVLARRGRLLLEVMVTNTPTAGDEALGLARETLELVRGFEVADPWDGTKGDEARKALLGALGDPHWGVRWRATRNLSRMKATPEIDAALERMLEDPDPSVSADAFRALARRGRLDGVDALAGHESWEVRLAYLRLMSERETDQEAAAARLIAALEDMNPAIRAFAFTKLEDIDAEEQIPWERMLAGIQDPDDAVRAAAFGALPHGELPDEAQAALLKGLHDADADIRSTSALWLRTWAKESAEVRDALVAALRDDSKRVRRHAAEGLAEAGREAAPAIRDLRRLLDDEAVRETAADALGEIGVADAVVMRVLETHLADPDLDFRFVVARALRKLGYDPKDLAPIFAERLQAGFPLLRLAGAQELGRLGETARPYIPDLMAALENWPTELRASAAEALGNLGAVAEEALPALDALGGKEEPETLKVDENGDPIFELGGPPSEAEVRHTAWEAARKIRSALAATKR